MVFQSFEEFWPFYIGEHRKPVTRGLHYVGTGLGYALGVAALVTMNQWLVPAGLLAGYGPAWVSHFFIEHNRPATFKHPLWSFRGDARMLLYFLTGRMGAEFARLEKQGFRYATPAAE